MPTRSFVVTRIFGRTDDMTLTLEKSGKSPQVAALRNAGEEYLAVGVIEHDVESTLAACEFMLKPPKASVPQWRKAS